MLGTSKNTMGGISSVVKVYCESNLLSAHRIRYISTHKDGPKTAKAFIALNALFEFILSTVNSPTKLVHIHISSRASFWRKSIYVLISNVFRIPVILHLHGSEFQIFYEDESGTAAKRFISYVFDSASHVVVLSDTWKDWVSSISKNPRIIPIYNPASLPPVATPFSARDEHTLLFLGRLGKRKGTYDLLHAIAKISGEFPNLKLLLGGDGEIDLVKGEVSRLGIENHVTLLGWVSGEQKEQLLKAASIYVLPSYNEGLPMSILEAMAAGLPIVSTPIGGIPEAITDGFEGRLVEPGDVDGLAAALRELLGNADLRQRMGAAARTKVENTFSADIIIPQVEAIYRELGA